MTSRENAAAPTLRTGRAMVTLLRLADADLRDGAVLVTGRNPANVAALTAQALSRMVLAVAATEAGWPLRTGAGLDDIPDQNPLKRQLFSLMERLPSAEPPVPSRDGQAPPAPDSVILRDSLLAARTLLESLAGRSEVDLRGNGPAKSVVAARPEPPPPRLRKTTPSNAPEPAKLKPSASAATPTKTPRLAVVAAPPARGAEASPAFSLTAPRPQRGAGPSRAAESHLVEGRSALQRPIRPGTVSSAVFWSLMDYWKVADTEALSLIGHPGGLTKKGTRPRFKLVGGEVEALLALQEIDTALSALKQDPTLWLRKPVKEQPFSGTAPLAFLTREAVPGVRAAIRFLLQSGLRMYVTTSGGNLK